MDGIGGGLKGPEGQKERWMNERINVPPTSSIRRPLIRPAVPRLLEACMDLRVVLPRVMAERRKDLHDADGFLCL